MLKLECRGGRYYKTGEVLSEEDLEWLIDGNEPKKRKFRGAVRSCLTDWRDGKHVYVMEIAIEYHAMIASGEYKPRMVYKSQPNENLRRDTQARPAAAKTIPPQPQKIRHIHLSDE